MIIDNEKEKMPIKNKLIIGGAIGITLIAVITGVVLLSNKNKNQGPVDLGSEDQLTAVMKEYLPDHTGGVSIKAEEFKEIVEEQNEKINKSSGNKFTAKTINLSNFEHKSKYYKDRTQTDKVPDYIKEDDINKAEEDISAKVKLIIQLDGEDYKERITKTALKVEEKIVDQAKYDACNNKNGLGGLGEDESELQGGENPSNDNAGCGVEYVKSEFLGEEWDASILGGIVYGYKDKSLDIATGLELKTFRELSPRASWWLENTTYPYPFYSTIIDESKFYNNAIVNGYWNEIDFKNIDNLIIKEDGSITADGIYKRIYSAAFQSNGKWYKAEIVEQNQDLRLYDIRYVS